MDDSVRLPPQDDAAAGSGEERAAASGDPYLVALGNRVRSMRAIRGMSRKILARESGVSERYVAQLEGGLGNLSIMLLRRVAAAMGAPLDDLVAEDRPGASDIASIRERLREASPDILAQVKALLDGGAPMFHAEPSRERIALIGLRGAGKSTLGRLAAEKLGWPFVELNREIERQSGLAVAEVFSLYGQDGYRRLEGAALERVIERPGPMILATGGGIVAAPATFDRLLGSFHTIWVRAEPGQHMKRVRAQGDTRPMGKDRAAMAELETILSSRTALYARARDTVDTSRGGIDAGLTRLLSSIAGETNAASRG